MKKYLVMLFGIMSFIGINTVSADTYDFNFSLEEYASSNLSEIQLRTYLDEKIDILLKYWEKNLKNEYPYYFVSIDSLVIGSNVNIYFHYLKAIPINDSSYRGDITPVTSSYKNALTISLYCSENSDTCNEEIIQLAPSFSGYYNPVFYERKPYDEVLFRHYLPFSYYTSNFDYIFSETDVFNIVKNDEIIYTLNNGDIIPTYKDLFINDIKNRYIEIDLNEYAYVALSLKDYITIPENNYSTYSNIYVKGQLCSTPVYNYGQTERKDVLTGTQVQGCTSYYNDFTLLRKYILKTDVENHAIYYLKGYDSTKENKVKIDSSIYNITYITEENKDNPQVNINGKIYPTLSYDNLTDTATKSEDDGYIPGVSCPVGDLNCYNEYNSENIFKDLFDNPLKSLQNVWTAITSIFGVITGFILLLPPTMQGFLYVAFGTTIMLGIIKILL